MKCNHETQYLIGNANGITCRRCGQTFKSFDQIAEFMNQPEAGTCDDLAPVPEPEEKPKRGRRKKGDTDAD